MLEKIEIKATDLTPLILLDSKNSIVQIKGILVPENAYDFFHPIFSWLDKYQLQPVKNVKFEFELDYFNTSSSRMLLEIMRRVQKIPNQEIAWILDSEDEDMIEVVEDYNQLLGGIININLKVENPTSY